MMPVPVDDDGLDVDALEQLVRRRQIKLLASSRACTTRPAATSPRSAARRLIELARREGFFIVEDGVYADLRFEGEPPAALRRTPRST